MVSTITATDVFIFVGSALAVSVVMFVTLLLIPDTRRLFPSASFYTYGIPVLVALVVIGILKVSEIILDEEIVLFLALLVIGLLVSQHLLEGLDTRQKMLADFLNIVTIPLLLGYAVIVGLKMAEILG